VAEELPTSVSFTTSVPTREGRFAKIREVLLDETDEPDEPDAWGYSSALTDRAARDTHRRLDEDEREAGHDPW